jgi:Family of unknown function (DUF5675)
MPTKIIRIQQKGQSTLSHLYINDIFQCYLLEDAIRLIKVKKETALFAGKWTMRLNTEGAMNQEYAKRFPVLHKGMIEILTDQFQSTYIHIGNFIRHTEGCPLVGTTYNVDEKDKQNFMVSESERAYKFVYPVLLSLIEKGDTAIEIINQPYIQPLDREVS